MTDGQNEDDGLEKRLGGAGNFNPASDVDRAPQAKKCVARVWHDAGPGSGVLLPGNWFLTNHHVLPTAEKAKAAVSQFNYERQADGKFAQMKQYHFDPDAGFHTSPVTGGDDWTVVKLKGDANAEIGAVTLEDVTPKLNEIVSIIQHPDAGPRQVAQGTIIEVVDAPRRIRYRVDTLPGSSGSPVFNGRWQVVGLHHSSATSRNRETGAAIECNEGISMGAILEGLKAKGVWPFRPGTGDFRLPNGLWDIERKASKDALRHLQKRRLTVALKGGKQMGKGLIARRVEAQMEAEGWQAIAIDLAHEFDDADYETGHGFMRRLSQRIVEQVHANAKTLTIFDRDRAPTAFVGFLDLLKQDRPALRLLLTLDRVDVIGERRCCSPVLGALRIVHTAQEDLREVAWLRMLLIHSNRPQKKGKNGSAFDVARVVFVDDFTQGELQKLATLYGLPGIDVTQLHSFLGGHPALSQLTLTTIEEDQVSLDEIVAEALKNGGLFREHLDAVIADLRALPEPKEMTEAFRALALHDQKPASEETFEALFAIGAVKGTFSGDAEVRSELYKKWITPRIAK